MAALATLILSLGFNLPADAQDTSGYVYGTDSSCPIVQGAAPYTNANYAPSGCGGGKVTLGDGSGYFGGYFGMVGNFMNLLPQCSVGLAFNSSEASRALTNHTDGHGIGVVDYYLAGGPGADPAYNANYTAAQAMAWGTKQGQAFYTDWVNSNTNNIYDFIDIESNNGWNEKLSGSCDHLVSGAIIPAALDRDVFNGIYTKASVDTAFVV